MTRLGPPQPVPASFRDPTGYVFHEDGLFKRVVTPYGQTNYETYVASGLHAKLAERGLVVDYHEEPVPSSARADLHTILVPEQIPFVSYPYEWCFDQLKDAALLTLDVQDEALACGMSLKDASAYNVQFIGSKPVFIDLSSFEVDQGGPWIGYEQFCRHFLGPLLLMQRVQPDFNRFLCAELEGFPLDLVSRLLPRQTWLNPDILINIHLHARFRGGNTASAAAAPQTRKSGLKANVLSSLRDAVKRTRPPADLGRWTQYETNRQHYSQTALDFKLAEVRRTLVELQPKTVYDLGGNSGEYSAEATQWAGYCVSLDSDAGCVTENYRRAKEAQSRSLLPLMMDLKSPSPDAGFGLSERSGLLDRPTADLALVLALIHHLRVTARAPFRRIAQFLAGLAKSALIEFVPITDPMVRELMGAREDPLDDYTLDGFRDAFDEFFELSHHADIPDSGRTLWFARRRLVSDA